MLQFLQSPFGTTVTLSSLMIYTRRYSLVWEEKGWEGSPIGASVSVSSLLLWRNQSLIGDTLLYYFNILHLRTAPDLHRSHKLAYMRARYFYGELPIEISDTWQIK